MIDGFWSYRSAVAAPIALELELWQVGKNDSVTGRLVHWMSGDVGQEGSRTVKLTGAVKDNNVWFEIPLPAPAAAVRIEGTVAGDTLTVTKATTGGDDNGLSGGRFIRTGPVRKP